MKRTRGVTELPACYFGLGAGVTAGIVIAHVKLCLPGGCFVSELPELSGVWRLRSYFLRDVETSERFDPFGARPNGVLILLPCGRLSALLTAEGQKQPASEAEEADAFRRMIAYSGQFRLEPPDQFVTKVDVAWSQPWVGSEQVRKFALDGDALDIISAPTRSPFTGDAVVEGVISWVREAALDRGSQG
jgi:hypothetical protein